MVTTKLNLSMTEPQVRQIYAKQGDTGRVLDISLDQTPEDGTLRILRPDGVEVTSDAVTGGEVESGETVSFESMTEADVTELTVGIEPVQDLNGYDKPWVGGAGKNKWAFGDQSFTREKVITLENDIPAGTYMFSAVVTSTATTTCNLVFVDTGGNNISRYMPHNSVRTALSAAIVADNPIHRVILRSADNYSSSAGIDASYVDIQLELGSSATTYSPYSNICPITGHDEVAVYDDPVYDKTINWNQLANIADASFTSASGITCTVENGHITYKGTVTQGANFVNVQEWAVAQSDFVVGHKYLFRVRDTIRQGYARGLYFVVNNPYSEVPYLTGTPMSFIYTPTALPTYCFLRVYIFTTVGQEIDGDGYVGVFDLTEMFGEGNEPTIEEFDAFFPKDYYPYNTGEETTVSAVNGDPNRQYTTSLGQTVYGGTLDLVSGVLTVDKVSVTYSSGVSRDGSGSNVRFYFTQNDFLRKTEYTTDDIMCDKLPTVRGYTKITGNALGISGYSQPISQYPNNNFIYFGTGDSSITEVADMNTWLANNPLQIVYKLKTPIEYQLTPQQIKTLVGTNNVWASSGDIVSIKFTYGGLLSELPSDATEIVGKCYCDVEQNGVSSMPFTLNVKKNERES